MKLDSAYLFVEICFFFPIITVGGSQIQFGCQQSNSYPPYNSTYEIRLSIYSRIQLFSRPPPPPPHYYCRRGALCHASNRGGDYDNRCEIRLRIYSTLTLFLKNTVLNCYYCRWGALFHASEVGLRTHSILLLFFETPLFNCYYCRWGALFHAPSGGSEYHSRYEVGLGVDRHGPAARHGGGYVGDAGCD